MRISKNEYYLGIALAVSKRSTCLKRHYGCVIVKNNIIVATGYNGSPSGETNCCDIGECEREDANRYSDYEKCKSVHAEQNAIMQCSYENLQGATLYLACEEHDVANFKPNIFYEDKNPIPCFICKRMIKNSGIKRVINRSTIFDERGVMIWE